MMPDRANLLFLFLSVVAFVALTFAQPSWSADPVESNSGIEITLPAPADNSLSAETSERFRLSHLEHGQHSDYVLRYPLKYWRDWSNQKLSPVRVLLCMLILVSITQLFCPVSLGAAREIYDRQRLRMFGIGALTCTLGCVVAGFLYRLELFAPLAGLLLALVQLVELFGLAVASQSIGNGLFSLIRLGQWQQQSQFGHLARIWSGAFLLSLIVLIPRIGALPPVGNRLLCLIAVAGAGAALTFIRNRKNSPAV